MKKFPKFKKLLLDAFTWFTHVCDAEVERDPTNQHGVQLCMLTPYNNALEDDWNGPPTTKKDDDTTFCISVPVVGEKEMSKHGGIEEDLFKLTQKNLKDLVEAWGITGTMNLMIGSIPMGYFEGVEWDKAYTEEDVS
jgi:hypothetical protein